MITRIAILTFTALLGLACTPVTLSHQGRVDFEQYRSVFVEPILLSGSAVFPDEDRGTQLYLVDELRLISGFTTVAGTSSPTPSTVLTVEMRVDSEEDFETGQIRYTARTEFTLRTIAGVTLVSDSTSSSDNNIREAQEEALESIALFFLKPYRI